MRGLIILLPLILVVAVIWVAAMYNALVRLRNQVENGWAQIDVQLKRRYDLIPNLIEAVKGYATHERATLERVTEARARAISAQTVGEHGTAENALSGALKALFAVAEAYPDLKANQNFLRLQEELSSTENRIAFARQFYNDATMHFNTRTQTFPSNFIAGIFNFVQREYFQLDSDTERAVPQAKF